MKNHRSALERLRYLRSVNRTLSNSIFLPLGGLLLLAACSNTNVPTTVKVTGMPNPELALQKSMDHVNQDMSRIGGLQPRSETTSIALNADVPAPLKRTIALFFNGKLEKAVDILANKSGYAVSVERPKKIKSLRITTRFPNITIFEALRSLGEQIGNQADIEIDNNSHLIRVIYHG